MQNNNVIDFTKKKIERWLRQERFNLLNQKGKKVEREYQQDNPILEREIGTPPPYWQGYY